MEQTYDRIQTAGSGDVAQAVVQPNPAEIYGQLDSTINDLATNFESLPPETQEHLRKAMQPINMPQAWGQDRSELWSKLDRSAQAYIAERELQAAQKISELGNRGKLPDEFGSVMEKYGSVIPRGPDGNPMAPPAVMESLLVAHHALETHPAAAIQWLANSYGVNLGELAHDPRSAAQQAQYAQAAQQLQNQLAQMQAQHQQWHAKRMQYIQREAENYIREKDYWPSIEDEVIRQVNAVKETNPGLVEADPLAVMKEAEKRAGHHWRRDQAERHRSEEKGRRRQASRIIERQVGPREITEQYLQRYLVI
jgi:hypothetical protein